MSAKFRHLNFDKGQGLDEHPLAKNEFTVLSDENQGGERIVTVLQAGRKPKHAIPFTGAMFDSVFEPIPPA